MRANLAVQQVPACVYADRRRHQAAMLATVDTGEAPGRRTEAARRARSLTVSGEASNRRRRFSATPTSPRVASQEGLDVEADGPRTKHAREPRGFPDGAAPGQRHATASCTVFWKGFLSGRPVEKREAREKTCGARGRPDACGRLRRRTRVCRIRSLTRASPVGRDRRARAPRAEAPATSTGRALLQTKPRNAEPPTASVRRRRRAPRGDGHRRRTGSLTATPRCATRSTASRRGPRRRSGRRVRVRADGPTARRRAAGRGVARSRRAQPGPRPQAPGRRAPGFRLPRGASIAGLLDPKGGCACAGRPNEIGKIADGRHLFFFGRLFRKSAKAGKIDRRRSAGW